MIARTKTTIKTKNSCATSCCEVLRFVKLADYYDLSGRLIVGDSVPGVEFLPFVKAKRY